MPEPYAEETWRPCPRGEAECKGRQYPQDDGECRWWACDSCGFEDGYQLSKQAAGACSVGVAVVTQDGYFMETGAGLQPRDFTRPQPVFLGQITRRPS